MIQFIIQILSATQLVPKPLLDYIGAIANFYLAIGLSILAT